MTTIGTVTERGDIIPSNMCMPSKKLHAVCDGTVILWRTHGQINDPGKGQRSVERCPCTVCNHPPVE